MQCSGVNGYINTFLHWQYKYDDNLVDGVSHEIESVDLEVEDGASEETPDDPKDKDWELERVDNMRPAIEPDGPAFRIRARLNQPEIINNSL